MHSMNLSIICQHRPSPPRCHHGCSRIPIEIDGLTIIFQITLELTVATNLNDAPTRPCNSFTADRVHVGEPDLSGMISLNLIKYLGGVGKGVGEDYRLVKGKDSCVFWDSVLDCKGASDGQVLNCGSDEHSDTATSDFGDKVCLWHCGQKPDDLVILAPSLSRFLKDCEEQNSSEANETGPAVRIGEFTKDIMDLFGCAIADIVFTEERVHLVQNNGDGDGSDEATKDRKRYKFEEESELQEAEYHTVDTHHEGCRGGDFGRSPSVL
ncbi:hypothetical protein HG531_010627 [Fusarium graminearum]|nr:hypothetical protein HG531_010627 [Fusarium graminearum]